MNGVSGRERTSMALPTDTMVLSWVGVVLWRGVTRSNENADRGPYDGEIQTCTCCVCCALMPGNRLRLPSAVASAAVTIAAAAPASAAAPATATAPASTTTTDHRLRLRSLSSSPSSVRRPRAVAVRRPPVSRSLFVSCVVSRAPLRPVHVPFDSVSFSF